jgi:hypothetical protein
MIGVRTRCRVVRCELRVAAHVLLCGGVFLLPALPASPARGEVRQSQLVLQLSSAYDSVRGQSPLPVVAHLAWTSPRLLEGRLQLKLYSDERHVATWISRDIALAGSEVSLPALLPPVVLENERAPVSVQATFLGTNGELPLNLHDIPVPADWRRVLVVGLIHAAESLGPLPDFSSADEDRFSLQHSLRLEEYHSIPEYSRELASRFVPLDPAEAPESALELLAFDMLVVSSEALVKLTASRLAALSSWVEGGGSLCVVAERAPTSAHEAFLLRMADSSATDRSLTVDSQGIPRLLGPGDGGLRCAFPGAGRTVVATAPIDPHSTAWRRAVLHLWGVRSSQVEPILETGRWRFDVPREYEVYSPFLRPFAPKSSVTAEQLHDILLPDRIQGIPFASVCMILALCLVTVSAGDYLLLGWLRRRRWTWAVFPAVAMGFTLFTMRLAHTRVGQADHRTALTFVDVTRDGRVARHSRFELLFTATERTVESSMRDVFAAPFEDRPEARDRALTFGGTIRLEELVSGPSAVLGVPLTYAGMTPQGYSLRQPMRQWSPDLTRQTGFGDPGGTFRQPLQALDWEALSREDLSDPKARTRVVDSIRRAIPQSCVIVIRGKDTFVSTPEGAADDSAAIKRNGVIHLVAGASAAAEEGLFAIVSRVSPTAAGNFEDLALLDRTDPAQAALLIVIDDGAGSHVAYRRLFRNTGGNDG